MYSLQKILIEQSLPGLDNPSGRILSPQYKVRLGAGMQWVNKSISSTFSIAGTAYCS